MPRRRVSPGLLTRSIALSLAVFLALFTIAAGALHHHQAGAGPDGCQACAWIHTVSTGVQAVTPTILLVGILLATVPIEPAWICCSIPAPYSGRAPPPIDL
jgi:hypothetical protein